MNHDNDELKKLRTRLEGFVDGVRAGLDCGLPITAEDVCEGLLRAHELRYAAVERLRFEEGLALALDRARRRQDADDREAAVRFGAILRRTQK